MLLVVVQPHCQTRFLFLVRLLRLLLVMLLLLPVRLLMHLADTHLDHTKDCLGAELVGLCGSPKIRMCRRRGVRVRYPTKAVQLLQLTAATEPTPAVSLLCLLLLPLRVRLLVPGAGCWWCLLLLPLRVRLLVPVRLVVLVLLLHLLLWMASCQDCAFRSVFHQHMAP